MGTLPSSCFSFQVLLPAAGLLQLQDVKRTCCEFLESQLHPINCLGIRAFADMHACTDLLSKANTYAGMLSLVEHTLICVSVGGFQRNLGFIQAIADMFLLMKTAFDLNAFERNKMCWLAHSIFKLDGAASSQTLLTLLSPCHF